MEPPLVDRQPVGTSSASPTESTETEEVQLRSRSRSRPASRSSTTGERLSRAHDKLRQLHDELTECPICLAQFTNPKQLPCMHSFCLACLKSMTVKRDPGDRIACPMCNQPFTVPIGGVDALPKNYVVDRLVELLRSASVQVSVR